MGFSLYTERLHLSELKRGDEQFVYDLFNDPDCIRFIGDRGINNLSDAEGYLQNKLIDSYRKHGFGLYKVALKNTSRPMGICGLVKRDESNPPDLGFAFLPQFRAGGYCTEAALGLLKWVDETKWFKEILAYTNPDNLASIKVLEKIGFQKQNFTTLPGQDFQSLILTINLLQQY